MGEELNQLAGFLFGQASNLWWRSRALEVVGGLIAVALVVLGAGDQLSGAGAIVSTVLVVVAYAMRLWFEDKYETAETMRRQSVLSEGLGWSVSVWQRTEWLRKAGPKLQARLRTESRVPDYYGSQSPAGAKRLAEMTLESEFYTRHQYLKVRNIALTAAAIATVSGFVVLLAAANQSLPRDWEFIIARGIFVAIPVVLAVDFLGWVLRLNRITSELGEIEKALDRQLEAEAPEVPDVMRLVSEYNCQVIAGIPMPWRFWEQWHDEIRELWEKRS